MPPLHQPTPAQRRAADPARSVWVTANAGTGKTRVLADRVVRLLLEGAAPEGILAITFTKAAAAEMTHRIGTQLARWATAGDVQLAAEIEAIEGRPADSLRLARARSLFAAVLELPRGLSILTIHALCGQLLRRFPLEAGVPPHFSTIDSRDQQELMLEAREAVLLEARDPSDARLAMAIERLAVSLAETSLVEAMNELMASRVRLQRAAEPHGGLEGLLLAIATALRAEPGVGPADIIAGACANQEVRSDLLLHAVQALIQSKAKTDQERGAAIGAWLNAAPADRARLFHEAYVPCFVTQKGTGVAKLCTKAVLEARPDLARALEMEQARLLKVLDRIKTAQLLGRTEALLRVGFAAIGRYQEQKAREAALDFDDLIERTRRLLEAPGTTAWVLYKLDQRIEHVLVDEAQDTSPSQWAIIRQLVGEFFTGQGQSDDVRTLFVVGDEKQSIYSFQGADLASFRSVHDALQAVAKAAGQPIHEETLDRSFRSVRPVLELVDAVLALPDARAGVVDEGAAVQHATERGDLAGSVELWPLVPPEDEIVSDEAWALPGETPHRDDAATRLAEAIAARIAAWLEQGRLLEAEGRPLRAGDVLILLQRRGAMQERLVSALKRRQVPVAGADRLSLAEHLAVQDLVALGRVLLLPEDDLSLACLLKSPLVGLGEDDLLVLAHGRGQTSLMERLRAMAGEMPVRFGPAYGVLRGWLARADFMPPFELYASILGAEGGRKRLLSRLGPDALEPIDAFLGQTLAYERGHPSSLEGFLHWFTMEDEELKRDPDTGRHAVRVMTVHAAKGLEAPVVILADAGPHQPMNRGRLLWSEDGLPFWRAPESEREGVTEAAVQAKAAREEQERRRLLYVALTRAREELIVAGWLPRKETRTGCWHETVAQALAGMAGVQRLPCELGHGITGEVLRHHHGRPAPLQVASDKTPGSGESLTPAWLDQPAPEEPRPGRPLAPSHLGADEPASSPVGEEAEVRRQIGFTLHHLLQLVPDLPASDRRGAVLKGINRELASLPVAERTALAERLMALMATPALAALFGPDSRAEQALAGIIGGTAVAGQVDRLLVTPDEVVLADLKTGRTPASLERTPVAYLRQMAAYTAILGQIYADRPVRAALLWLETLEVAWLPQDLLRRHLPPAP